MIKIEAHINILMPSFRNKGEYSFAVKAQVCIYRNILSQKSQMFQTLYTNMC